MGTRIDATEEPADHGTTAPPIKRGPDSKTKAVSASGFPMSATHSGLGRKSADSTVGTAAARKTGAGLPDGASKAGVGRRGNA